MNKREDSGLGMFEKVYLTKAQATQRDVRVIIGWLFGVSLFSGNPYIIVAALIAFIVVPLFVK